MVEGNPMIKERTKVLENIAKEVFGNNNPSQQESISSQMNPRNLSLKMQNRDDALSFAEKVNTGNRDTITNLVNDSDYLNIKERKKIIKAILENRGEDVNTELLRETGFTLNDVSTKELEVLRGDLKKDKEALREEEKESNRATYNFLQCSIINTQKTLTNVQEEYKGGITEESYNEEKSKIETISSKIRELEAKKTQANENIKEIMEEYALNSSAITNEDIKTAKDLLRDLIKSQKDELDSIVVQEINEEEDLENRSNLSAEIRGLQEKKMS